VKLEKTSKIKQVKNKSMLNTVKVIPHPETGKVFTQKMNEDGTPHLDKNGEEHGVIRVQSRKANLGFAYKSAVKTRNAFIQIPKKSYEESADLFTAGSIHEGKIVREDSLTPWYEGQKPLDNGKGITITSDGAPVYRRELFTESLSRTDVKLTSYDKIEKDEVSTSAKSQVLNG
jgi:hypothetical protein